MRINIQALKNRITQRLYENKEKIKDGSKNGKTATVKELADKWNLTISEIEKLVAEGQKVELEHTDDPVMAAEIARDHIFELENYYKKLKQVEKK